MILIERESISDELGKLFQEAVGGRGQVALLTGAVGCGKTAMLHAFVEQAAESGALPITAAGSLAEQSLPLGLVGQLFQSTPVASSTAEELTGLLDIGWPPEGPPRSGHAIRQSEAKVVHAAYAALRELAKDHPLVIGVDDLHLADPASQHVLLYLQRRIRSLPILMVLTERIENWHGRSGLRVELTRHPCARQLRLSPLTANGVGRLLEHRLGAAVTHWLRDPVHTLSGGNPLLVHALVDDYLAGDADETGPKEAEPVVGEAFRRAMLDSLHRDGAELPQVAAALAVLGEFATIGAVADLLSIKRHTVKAALRALDAAGLIDESRFRHPEARAAVLGALPGDEYVSLHLRAAGLLHRAGVTAGEVAHRIIAAGIADKDWMVDVLKEAAEHALSETDLRHTVECLELATRAAKCPFEKATLTARLARVQSQLNPSAAAQHLAELERASAGGQLDERDSLALVRSLAWHGRADSAASVLSRLGGQGDIANAESAQEVQMTYQWLYYWHPTVYSRVADAPPVSQFDESVTSRNHQTPLLAGSTSESAEHVLQRCRVGETSWETAVFALHTLMSSDQNDRAAYWCDELLAEANSRQVSAWRAVLTDVRAGIALNVGNLPEAERLSLCALSLMSTQSWGVAIGSPLARLVLSATMMGNFELAGKQLKRLIPKAIRQTGFWPQFLQARGYHYLATDRLHAALDDFLTVGDLAVKWGLDFPALLPWRGYAAQTYVHLGKPQRARELIGEQLTRLGATGARIRGKSLRVLAMASEARKRPTLLKEAADLLQSCGDRYELAHVYADLSEVSQVLGEFNRARVTSRRAMQLAKACNAEVLRRRLPPSDSTPAAAVEPDGLYALSAAERRVAMLAALGYTNREIGRKLFITVSTVEQHLTRAYRKLNVSRRADLPAELSLEGIEGG